MELSIEQALQRAVEAHRAGHLQEAEALYRAIVQAQPNHADANHNLGVLAVSTHQEEAALPLFKTALEASPTQGQFWLSYIDALITTGRDDEARRVLAEGRALGLAGAPADALAARLAPADTSIEAMMGRLSACLERGAVVEAKAIALVLTRQHPAYALGWKALGVLLHMTGATADAVSANRRAVACAPEDAEVHNNLGIALRDLGRFDEAEASYRKAVAIKPDYAEAYSNLGIALKDLGRLDEAEASHRQAIALRPDLAAAHCNLGSVLRDRGRLHEAEASSRAALALAPDNAEVHASLADVLADRGHLAEAVSSYRRATALRPDFAEAFNNLGLALKDLGRRDEAEASYRQAIALKPGYAEAHCNLGNVLADLGRFEAAEASYRRAIAAKAAHAEAYCNLGSTLGELGRPEDAAASMRAALALKPDYAEAYSNLAILLKELDRTAEADASLRAALALKAAPATAAPGGPITALMPFGRAGSLFFHSLFDGHPDIATLPGIYFKGWFGIDRWRQLAPDIRLQDWRAQLVARLIDQHRPLFDARQRQNVPGAPLGNSQWLARDLGFMEMGPDRAQAFVADQDGFAAACLAFLQTMQTMDIKACFELVHRAFEAGVRKHAAERSRHILYHIHNPDPFELAHFLQHYPQARLLHLMRNPVQSLESWMLTNVQDRWETPDQALLGWSKMVGKAVTMFTNLRQPEHVLPLSRGLRLEDVKRDARTVMPQVAAWMGVAEHPALYESTFCGMQYWGPASKTTGTITGFDTKAIDQRVGRLFGPRDALILETLFWPVSRLYGYNEDNEADFRRRLAEIRPWLNAPLELETTLYSRLPDHSRKLEEMPQYKRLHRLLQLFWHLLDREGTYQGMVPPLQLN